MADPRKATQTIMLKNDGKNTLKIELFCASAWPAAAGARPGLVRLRVGGKWYSPGGSKFVFFNAAGVSSLLAALLAGKGLELPPRPDLPRGSAVRAPNGKVVAGQILYERTRTASAPILGADGRWHVPVALYGQGTVHVPVDELGG